MDELKERTIVVDCDVLQADGGTRVAGVTAASYVLQRAQQRWLQKGIIRAPLMNEMIAALSIGKVGDEIVVDLDQHSDTRAQADFNFVLTRSGKVVEIQGTAEKQPLLWEDFAEFKQHATQGIKQLFEICDQLSNSSQAHQEGAHRPKKKEKIPFFSLANR